MFAQNKNIVIRAAEPQDAKLIYDWENNRDIWRVSETYMPYSLYQIEQFLFSNDLFSTRQIRFIIERKNDNVNIGCIDIYDFDPVHMRAGIGILLQKDFRKQGYANEALELLIDYIFNTLMLKQIYCLIDETNIDSLNLFKKIGFTQCGLRKECMRDKYTIFSSSSTISALIQPIC